MSSGYSALWFGSDFFCEGCKARIVRRYTTVAIVDAAGNYVDASGYDIYPRQRLYEITCPKCEKVVELESPRDVKEYSVPEPTPGPRIVEVS